MDKQKLASAKSLPVHEMDTNILFEKFTVEEIREIEKKTRADIERKKEDLRIMVGERYRDLIEAADTITEMKNSAQNVMSSIAKMEDMCKQLKQRHMIKGSSFQQRIGQEDGKKQEVRFYGIASQIKFLLDMPEKIWSALDEEDYLTATRHFLLSRHIHTSLQLESQQSGNLLTLFPVLTRQWAAISHFRTTILQGCRNVLKQAGAKDEQIARALCSIIVLEDSTPRQVFNEFLLARTAAVQQLFHPSHQNASVKDQISLIVQLITTTVHQIHTVFYSPEIPSDIPCNLLLSILTKVTSEKQQDSGLLETPGSMSARCLPKSVLEFVPTLRSHAVPVSVQHLQDNCQQWINTCMNNVTSGVGKLLSFVNTVKRLADIRNEVWLYLKQDSSMQAWDSVCLRILNKQLSIWHGFLQPLFINRVKALIKFQLDTSTELTKRQITKVVMAIGSTEEGSLADTDLAGYIWRESPGDIPANMSWTNATSRSTSDNPGGLIMKAKAFTPVIQSLCKTYDEKLQGMLQDSLSYLSLSASEEGSEMSQPFDRLSDTDALCEHIQTTCTTCLEELLKCLMEHLELWEKSLQEIADDGINQLTQDKVLLVGRLCTAIGDMVPTLQQCIMGKSAILGTDSGRGHKKQSTQSSSKTSENNAWAGTKGMLCSCHKEAYRIWLDHLTQTVVSRFRNAVCSREHRDALIHCTRWDEVNIEEETEDGKKITSKIKVPMQASWYVQDLLYSLCREINRVGGHAVQRGTLQQLVFKVSDEIMKCFEEVISKSKKNDKDSCNNKAQYILFLQGNFTTTCLQGV
ncbi:conserved oligomeric Golgi complex subunit 1-like isoform X1 [Ostrea edulis]|uniref:conserved oligomeric Golgi complex subunit 1-like isoform X1 n=1 Tax=Ostrea edulis TaxID=37623 RepID=UPI0024AF01A0|nr:conserved oligomeric Golgi complex subunit 1-like isoform X1 [Ostrea edulis]